MNEPADRRDNQLVYYMGLVYLAILCAITLTWHFGGWSEDNYWPYLLAWTSCLMVFALSCIFAALQKATLWAVGLLIVGGTLCFPLGVFALAMSAARILKWSRIRRNACLSLSVFLLAGIAIFIAILSPRLREPPFDASGLLKGAPFSWCVPANFAALVKGRPYADLRNVALFCDRPIPVVINNGDQGILFRDRSKKTVLVKSDGPVKRLSFANFGLTRQDMWEVNAILRNALDSANYHPKNDPGLIRFREAQIAAMKHIIPRLDSRKIVETGGFLPFLVVDDAITTSEAFRNGAGLLVRLALRMTGKERSKLPEDFLGASQGRILTFNNVIDR
jgi:hypothetical protein